MTDDPKRKPFVRRMTEGDIEAVYLAASRAFADEEEFRNRSPEEAEYRKARYQVFLKYDPDGCFVADYDGKAVGAAIAIRRDDLWVLSLFIVDEEHRASGVGRELMRAALAYGGGCESAMIASSTHPAAMRSYSNAGFDLHPTFTARGKVRREKIPYDLGVREGTPDDFGLVTEVDLYLRGATHGPDIEVMTRRSQLFVSEREDGAKGYAVAEEGSTLILGATDEEVASELLWAALSTASEGKDVEVRWITARQNWAVRVVLEAGLYLVPDGPICVRGNPGPLTPYLPSGPYL